MHGRRDGSLKARVSGGNGTRTQFVVPGSVLLSLISLLCDGSAISVQVSEIRSTEGTFLRTTLPKQHLAVSTVYLPKGYVSFLL